MFLTRSLWARHVARQGTGNGGGEGKWLQGGGKCVKMYFNSQRQLETL